MAVDPNIKIVVADDSGTMRVMFKQILKQAGFENIIMADNGDDGINWTPIDRFEDLSAGVYVHPETRIFDVHT